MSGAAGVFFLMNSYPTSDEGFVITINDESLGKSTQFTRSKNNYKEIRQERLRQKLNRLGF